MICPICGGKHLSIEPCPHCYGVTCPDCGKAILRTDSWYKDNHDVKHHQRCEEGPRPRAMEPLFTRRAAPSKSTSSWGQFLNHGKT